MNLLTLQRQVAGAVMTPLTRTERTRRVAPDGRSLAAVAKKIIKPNDRLTSFERLEIYNRQYWFRVLDAFSDDFPGLRAILGDRRFDVLAQSYLTACPSRSFTMRNLGSRLESWLRKHPEFVGPALRRRSAHALGSAGILPARLSHRELAAFRRSSARSPRFQLALDMVRLEWAEIQTFDSASAPPVTAGTLAGADPAKLCLSLQPHIRLLDLRYPVDDLLLAIKHDTSTNVASNAVNERQKRKKVSVLARLKPAPVFLAIHRLENTVYFRRLDREEFAILNGLQKGRTLEHAIVAGFRGSSISADERAANAAAWFRNWSALGWFV